MTVPCLDGRKSATKADENSWSDLSRLPRRLSSRRTRVDHSGTPARQPSWQAGSSLHAALSGAVA